MYLTIRLEVYFCKQKNIYRYQTHSFYGALEFILFCFWPVTLHLSITEKWVKIKSAQKTSGSNTHFKEKVELFWYSPKKTLFFNIPQVFCLPWLRNGVEVNAINKKIFSKGYFFRQKSVSLTIVDNFFRWSTFFGGQCILITFSVLLIMC